MKRILILSVVAAFMLALPASSLVWGKAHVRLGKIQVCHIGDEGDEVITVSASALGAHLGHGDCQVPACDFNNVFQTGDDCTDVGGPDELGRCTGLNMRQDAGGQTDACPAGSF